MGSEGARVSGLPHPLTLTAHFCPECGEQCSCQNAVVYEAADETKVDGCTHACLPPAPVTYYCAICKVNAVDAEDGYDTCEACLKRM